MIFGGIPYYLNYLRPGYSLAQNVELLFFQENSPLKDEYRLLYSSLFKNADCYFAIIRELAKKRIGVTRNDLLESKNTVSGKELTKALTALEQCGFIRKYHSYSTRKNGALYQLIDPLTLFHLTVLESGRVDSWIRYIHSPAYYTWCGLAFEKVCLLHIKQIKQALGISGISSQEYAWRSKKTTPGAQIDLLIDRRDDVINLCEMKYSEGEYAIDAAYEKELIHKAETFRKESGTKKAVWLTMITAVGLARNPYRNEVIAELTGEDLFYTRERI